MKITIDPKLIYENLAQSNNDHEHLEEWYKFVQKYDNATNEKFDKKALAICRNGKGKPLSEEEERRIEMSLNDAHN